MGSFWSDYAEELPKLNVVVDATTLRALDSYDGDGAWHFGRAPQGAALWFSVDGMKGEVRTGPAAAVAEFNDVPTRFDTNVFFVGRYCEDDGDDVAGCHGEDTVTVTAPMAFRTLLRVAFRALDAGFFSDSSLHFTSDTVTAWANSADEEPRICYGYGPSRSEQVTATSVRRALRV
jgi:hypothetical protein